MRPSAPYFRAISCALVLLLSLQQHQNIYASALPSPLHLAGTIIKGAVMYGVYSSVIDRYAARKFAGMETVPSMLPLGKGRKASMVKMLASSSSSSEVGVSIPSVDDLRKTISRITNLVEDPSDRRRWNVWIMAKKTNRSNDKERVAALKGRYKFAYRSRVNYDERNGLSNSFYPIRRFFGMASRRVGTMTIGPDENEVSISDYFWIPHSSFRLSCIPIKITWKGRIKSTGGLLDNGKNIVWTETEMKLPFSTIERPSIPEKLRQTPWTIVKVEDGMLLLQRGDIGVLAYDRVGQ